MELKELVEKSIKISFLDSETKKKRRKNVFCTNNGKVAFFSGGYQYVTSSSKENMQCLKEAGYKEDYFYVPLSNSVIPSEH